MICSKCHGSGLIEVILRNNEHGRLVKLSDCSCQWVDELFTEYGLKIQGGHDVF